MIKLLGSLDKKKHYYVGVSGGVDSMAAFHFLRQMKFDVQPVFIHHETQTSHDALNFLINNGYKPYPLFINPKKPAGLSQEEHWRNERYRLFRMCGEVIVAHHLNDAVETWVWSSLHGQSKLIPYRNNNVVRPFLATPKAKLVDWAKNHGVDWIEDHSNADNRYQRNYVRNVLMPHVKNINPGIEKNIRKKLLARGVDTSQE